LQKNSELESAKSDRDYWREKAKSLESEVAKKDREGKELVKFANELPITKETLRLTQVANLALQNQITNNQVTYQRELTDKDRQIKEKTDEINRGFELYKKKDDEVKDLNRKNVNLEKEKSEKDTVIGKKDSDLREKEKELKQKKEEVESLKKIVLVYPKKNY